MQNEAHNSTDTIRAPGSNREGAASGVRLSANTTDRLEKLARWRMDASMIEFPEGAIKFEGGYAIVSRALLESSPDDHRDHADGNNQRRGTEGSDQERKPEGKVAAEGQEGESDDKPSGGRKGVAVKKMKVKPQDDVVRVLGLALREAEFLVNLSHENIIKLEGFVEDVLEEVIWLVFPWEENGTLKDFVALHDWEIPERISLIFDVARGVEYLHSRTSPICHGDLKSINILVNSKCRAVITDFGSAHHPVANDIHNKRERAIEEPESAPSLEATFCPSTNTITLTCKHYTVRWAAPELLEDDVSSVASDIWALGWVAYEVMTNSIPFQGVREPMVINRIVRGDLPSISSDVRMLLIQELCSVLGRCWNIDPSKRPAAKDCRESINWMPMTPPNPIRTGDRTGFVDGSAELLMKLGNMHERQSDYLNASKYYVKALGAYTNLADSKGKANVLEELAQIQRLQQEHTQAVKSYTEALTIYTDIGDKAGRASALWGLAEVHRAQNEYSQAVAFYSKCLQIQTDIGDRFGRAYALWGLASVHRVRNEYSQAVALYSECLQIQTDFGDKQGRAQALFGLAEVHRARNEYSKAVAFYSEDLQIRTDIGDRHGKAQALLGLGDVHRLRKEYSQASKFYSDALTIFTDINDKYGSAFALRGIGDTHRGQGDPSLAVHHYEQAAEIFKQLGNARHQAITLERAAYLRPLMEQNAAA